jgi:DNA-binding XRE family transcriptional regulator
MGMGVDFDVRGWRRAMGITQAEAADFIDCTTRSFCRWENGKVKPDPYSVNQMRRLMERKTAGLPLREVRPGLFKRRKRPSRPGAAPDVGGKAGGRGSLVGRPPLSHLTP